MESKDTNPKDAVGTRKVPISTVPVRVVSEIISCLAARGEDPVKAWGVIAEAGLAMLEGGRKYGRHNYRAAGVRASVYVDAVWRHVFLQEAYCGEPVDAPSGQSHLVKGVAGLFVLRDSMLAGNWVDDRPPAAGVETTVPFFFNGVREDDKTPDFSKHNALAPLWNNLFCEWWESGRELSVKKFSFVTEAICDLVLLRNEQIARDLRTVDALNEDAGKIIDRIPNALEPWTQKRVEAFAAEERQNSGVV